MLDHVGVSVADLDAMAVFYVTAFGFVRGEVRVLPGDVRAVLVGPPDDVALEFFERPGSTSGPRWSDPVAAQAVHGVNHFALRTTDVDRDYRRALDAGAQPVWDPRPAPAPWARFAYVSDPEGNLLELVQT